MQRWVYAHQNLGEPVHFDGSLVVRPVVPIEASAGIAAVFGVLDSGSPISVANAELFELLGVDIDVDDAVYEVPLSVGRGFESTPVFRVELRLCAPGDDDDAVVSWSLELGARRRWRLPFAVLLGQRGWFDSFPTRIDASTSTVELPNPEEQAPRP